MMLPILISVSEAPVSYFFCASAPLDEAAISAAAAERIASLRVVADIRGSPCDDCRDVPASLAEAFGLAAFNTICAIASTKTPPRDARWAAPLVGRLTRTAGWAKAADARTRGRRRAHHHVHPEEDGGHGA